MANVNAVNTYIVPTANREVTMPSQPAFFGYLAATVLNKTGNGTSYFLGTDALTEQFDNNADFNVNGTFTAPVSGKYYFDAHVTVTGCTIATLLQISVEGANANFASTNQRAAGAQDFTNNTSSIIDCDLGDTVRVKAVVLGEAGDTDDIYGGGTAQTYFSGYLVC